jgi:hypothetical protein
MGVRAASQSEIMIETKRPEGFRLELRHLAMVVVFFALFTTVLIPVANRLGARGILNPPLLLLVTSPWLLGVLILVFERKGPLKYWAAPLLLSLIAPAMATCHDWRFLQGDFRSHTAREILDTLLLNVALIGAFTLFVLRMTPLRCPECANCTMIPLRGLWGPEQRTVNTRWCAACGAKYWKTCEGEWREERRKTWMDEPFQIGAMIERAPEHRFNPDTRPVAPMVSKSAEYKVLMAAGATWGGAMVVGPEAEGERKGVNSVAG